MLTHSSPGSLNSSEVLRRNVALGVLLLCATLVAYWPALQGGFILDDGVYVTKPELRSWQGLWRIWFEVGATQQYYPFLYSAFWFEHRVWGDGVVGYHLVNILQHVTAACLLVVLVRRLALPGAWLAGFIFALHPVCVESVAWIAEQKNTLSMVFFLSSGLVYLHFDQTRRRWLYGVALGLFILALCSKTVTATLPAALLVVFWWQRGRLNWKRDVLVLLPWFMIGAAMGLFSAWVENKFVGANGEDFVRPLVERALVASRGVWFYLGKMIWPTDLMFMYPRWTVDASDWRQYLFPFGLLVVTISLGWLAFRRRGPLAGWLLFLGMLFPTMGFLNIYWFIISYVADHFVYLPSVGIIVPFAVGITLAARTNQTISHWLYPVLCGVLLSTLGLLTWRQSHIYRDYKTLCQESLAKNPGAWMLHHNLGVEVAGVPGHLPEAIVHFQESLRLKPNFAEAHFNLAQAWAKTPGKLPDAISEFEETLRLEPGDGAAQFNLANALADSGRFTEAIALWEKLVRTGPDFAEAHFNLARVLESDPARRRSVIDHLEAAVRTRADYPEAHNMLGRILKEITGRLPDAILHFQAALRTKPDFLDAHFNLANALAIAGRRTEAIREYESVLRISPDLWEARFNLGCMLMNTPGRSGDARAQFETVLRAQPNYEPALQMLKRFQNDGR